MLHVILFQPEIPPNTGNIIRLCANTGCGLHLIEPLGFALDDARLRRAGLDYHEWADLRVHAGLAECLDALAPARLFAISTRGTTRYDRVRYRAGDALLFGPETRGLPAEVLDGVPAAQRLRRRGGGTELPAPLGRVQPQLFMQIGENAGDAPAGFLILHEVAQRLGQILRRCIILQKFRDDKTR